MTNWDRLVHLQGSKAASRVVSPMLQDGKLRWSAVTFACQAIFR